MNNNDTLFLPASLRCYYIPLASYHGRLPNPTTAKKRNFIVAFILCDTQKPNEHTTGL